MKAPVLHRIQEIAMHEPTPEGHALDTSEATQPALPDSLDAILALGQRYLDERNFADAQQVFERACSLDPANVSARHNLGYVFECQGAIDSAIAAYEAVVQSPTPLAQSSFNLGILLPSLANTTRPGRPSNKPLRVTIPLPGPGSIWVCCMPAQGSWRRRASVTVRRSKWTPPATAPA
jgi:tetratricopeptide (TPR) repeat protein